MGKTIQFWPRNFNLILKWNIYNDLKCYVFLKTMSWSKNDSFIRWLYARNYDVYVLEIKLWFKLVHKNYNIPTYCINMLQWWLFTIIKHHNTAINSVHVRYFTKIPIISNTNKLLQKSPHEITQHPGKISGTSFTMSGGSHHYSEYTTPNSNWDTEIPIVPLNAPICFHDDFS